MFFKPPKRFIMFILLQISGSNATKYEISVERVKETSRMLQEKRKQISSHLRIIL